MFDRFNDILNGLRALGKTYSNSELVRKILRDLPKSWASKKDAILEAKDLNQLPLEELLGSLLTHEMGLYEEEENGSKSDKRRGMALKSKVIEDFEAEEDSDSDEEEMAMYARKFRRFIKKKKIWKKNRNQSSRDEPKKEFKKDFKKDPKRTVRSFVTTVTNLVMSNKTTNFPRSIQSTRRKARERQWQQLGVTVMSQALRRMKK